MNVPSKNSGPRSRGRPRFARAEQDAFRFLEMQDHVPYLDEASRQMELSVLTPLFLAGQRIRDERAANSQSGEADPRPAPLPVDVAIALIWGAFVGLIKAERLGYLLLTDEAISAAGEALWAVVMPGASPSWKTFRSHDDLRGEGVNRVQLPGVLGRQQLFPFATRIEASAIDGRKAIVLDYDLDANPAYIRKIHDEIREVEGGLFLGPAMWKTASSKVTVLWFALDTRTPSTWA